MELIEFLKIAKKKTYASFFSKPKIREGKVKEHNIRLGNFKYIDTYFGDLKFNGKEIVFLDEFLIWEMRYIGRILDKNYYFLHKKIYYFLKMALKQLPEDFPVRGPKNFNLGKYRYENNWNGNLNNFKGVEKIFYKKKIVYILEYCGGKVKLKK